MPTERKHSGIVVLVGNAVIVLLIGFYIGYGHQWYFADNLKICSEEQFSSIRPCTPDPPPPDPCKSPHVGINSLLCGGDVIGDLSELRPPEQSFVAWWNDTIGYSDESDSKRSKEAAMRRAALGVVVAALFTALVATVAAGTWNWIQERITEHR